MSPIPLFSLRPSPHLEADLRWYFNAADGEMGLRSNWEMYAREGMYLTRRRSTFSTDLANLMPDLRGAHRAAPIARALQLLQPHQRAVLFTAYADIRLVMHAWPGIPENDRAALIMIFRDLAGLAPFAAHEEHLRSRTTREVIPWLLRLSSRSKKGDLAAARSLAAVRAAAESQLSSAMRAYSSERRLTRRG